MTELECNRRAALWFANKQRRRLGKPTLAELPMGIPGNGGKCALTNALNGIGWCTIAAWESGNDNLGTVPLTPRASQFVQDFDRGRYPDLIDLIDLTEPE